MTDIATVMHMETTDNTQMENSFDSYPSRNVNIGRHREVVGSNPPQGGSFFLTFLVLFVDFYTTNLFSPNLT